MKRKNKGISLIVLVITIIVMTILAGTIILSIRSEGLKNKSKDAVKNANLKQVEELATMLWADAYLDTSITTDAQYRNYVIGELAKQNIDVNLYAINVDKKGVEVYEFPNGWRTNVSTIASNVPIPNGFVASPYDDEDSKGEGLVIYQLRTDEIEEGLVTLPENESQHTSQTTRNQYVWIPVEDFEDFKRKQIDTANITLSNEVGKSDAYWEVIIDASTNMPSKASMESQSAFLTTTTPSGGITNTLAEVQAMYESVKKYGGFYIARYEAGLTTQRKAKTEALTKGGNVYSMMGKKPYTYVGWTNTTSMANDLGGAVEVARSMYPVTATSSNYGVVSTLTYGVQWDAACDWMLNGTRISNSTAYGNYSDHVVTSASELNRDAEFSTDNGGNYNPVPTTYTKTDGDKHLYTTGALKVAKVKNVYDMAGNAREWTMEGTTATSRLSRGGYYAYEGTHNMACRRPNGPSSAQNYLGFRPSLYIK